MQEVVCVVCGKIEFVCPSRFIVYKTCSIICKSKSKKKEKINNAICNFCGKEFWIRNSGLKKNKHSYCSQKCSAENKRTIYLGKNNPNFRNAKFDSDGYGLSCFNGKKMKNHIGIAYQELKISSIPKNFHVHHRDGNKNNNVPNNLSILHISDHVWLHKQFGSALIWAYINNKIDLAAILAWVVDKKKAEFLLTLSLEKQKQIGVNKYDENSK